MSKPFSQRRGHYEKPLAPRTYEAIGAAIGPAIGLPLVFLAQEPVRRFRPGQKNRQWRDGVRGRKPAKSHVQGASAGTCLDLAARHLPGAPNLYSQRWTGAVFHLRAFAAGDAGGPHPDLAGLGGVRHEDVVVVTKDGSKILSRFPKPLEL